MVHRVRSPGDRVYVTIYGDRSAMTGPVAREFSEASGCRETRGRRRIDRTGRGTRPNARSFD